MSNGPTPQSLAAAEMNGATIVAIALVRTYLSGVVDSTSATEFAVIHLVARSLDDIDWARDAAGEGYPLQAYSLLRPVSESANLIKLFTEQPGTAEDWAAGNYQNFSPVKVRTALGISSDPIYSFMCEHSHPRFAGIQATIPVIPPDEGGRPTAVVHAAGYPFELPPVLLATAWPGKALLDLLMAAGHMRVSRDVAVTWPATVREAGETLRPGFRAVFKALADMGDDDGLGDELLREMDDFIAATAEIERAVQNEHS